MILCLPAKEYSICRWFVNPHLPAFARVLSLFIAIRNLQMSVISRMFLKNNIWFALYCCIKHPWFLASEGDLPIILRRLIVTSSDILYKLWISQSRNWAELSHRTMSLQPAVLITNKKLPEAQQYSQYGPVKYTVTSHRSLAVVWIRKWTHMHQD